jgi:transposase InsO family protein
MEGKLAEDKNENLVKRFEMIAPLLNKDLDQFERRRLRARILETSGISARSLRRYIQQYREQGYKSLSHTERKDKGKLRSVPEVAVDEAVKLRQELPTRSVRRIIEILEGEKLVKPGEVSRTSLNRRLAQRGYGAAQLRAKRKATKPAGRFERRQRNSLWQADLKFGPVVDVNGRMKKTYLMALIDDKTRMIMHSEFYESQRLPILEDCFRKALLKFGKPVDVLVDNGKIFVSKWFRLACAYFGIRHIRAMPYAPETKGKLEKYNQTVDQFLDEFSLEPVQTLAVLNKKFSVWMEEGYTYSLHGALKIEERDPRTGRLLSSRERTPYQAYVEDHAKITYVSSINCREAFLWEVTRTADNSGCVSLSGVIFDVGKALARKRVSIRYDPFDISVVEVWHDGKMQRKAEKLSMREHLPKNAKAPAATPAKPTHSRLLKVYEEKNAAREKLRNGALSFRNYKEED